MRIVCAGGGPAGLYFAIQIKRRDPSHQIAVFERNGPDDTFGWGVVFSDETLRNLEGADPLSKQEILETLLHIAPYAGFPACWEGLQIADRVFRERIE